MTTLAAAQVATSGSSTLQTAVAGSDVTWGEHSSRNTQYLGMSGFTASIPQQEMLSDEHPEQAPDGKHVQIYGSIAAGTILS